MVNKVLNSLFNDKAIFRFSKDQQKKYIEHFGSPKDEIDRSFYQYKCQTRHLNFFIKLFLNIAAFFALVLTVSQRKRKKATLDKQTDNLFLFVHDNRNVPPKYQKSSFLSIEKIGGESWSEKAELYFKVIKKRYGMHSFFLLKVYKKMAFYQFLFDRYNPQRIITSNEYSFTSSILTKLCNVSNITHIDVMHGEKLFYFGDSFFYFNKIYAWDEFYIRLFTELCAKWDNAEIYFPHERFTVQKRETGYKHLTYYLQTQSKTEMKNLCHFFDKLIDIRITVRPHPRYGNIKQCLHIFKKYTVEDFYKIGIEESLANAGIVVSAFSTVLLQAKCSDIPYLIDDVSNVKNYQKLKDLDYRLIENNALSQLMVK